MTKSSITRALTELKMMGKRIESATRSLIMVDAYQNRTSTLMGSKKTKQDFETAAKADLQSVTDMIKRYRDIKAAIVASNAVEKITIGNDTMTVASAIETKKSIAFKKALLKKLQENWTATKGAAERTNLQIEENLQQLLTSMFGSDKKTDPAVFEETAKSFREKNEVRIFDPENVEKKIKELEEEITKFEGEVDFALSESNARTEIEI